MYEDSYLDSYWEDQYEVPDSHDEWDEWEKDRLCEDLALEREYDEVDEVDEEDVPYEDEGDLYDEGIGWGDEPQEC
jgi:hypothetical protein